MSFLCNAEDGTWRIFIIQKHRKKGAFKYIIRKSNKKVTKNIFRFKTFYKSIILSFFYIVKQ